jgi:nicotinamidase-related amidase
MSTALLLVEIQNDYFSGGNCELYQSEAAAVQASRALAFFREKRMPVFHVQHVALKPDAAFILPATRGAEIYASVLPAPGEPVVVKHAPDSFLETQLSRLLEEKTITRLVVCGMMSHMCIDTTVRSAKRLGYAVTLLHDACATKDLTWNGRRIPAETVHGAFMAALDGTFATVITTDAYLAAMED